MASSSFGDDFTGGGFVEGSAGQLGTLSATTWDANQSGASGMQRSASGGQSEVYDSSGFVRIRLYPTSLTLGAGVAVFEFAAYGAFEIVLGLGVGNLTIDVAASSPTSVDLYQPDGSSSFHPVSSRALTTLTNVRVEVQSTATRVYLDGALIRTAAGIASATSVDQIAVVWHSAFSRYGSGVQTRIDYVNFKTQTTTGALGRPGASDTTAPTMSGTVNITALGATSYRAGWAAGADLVGVTGYQVRLNAGAWLNVGLVLTYTVTGRTASSTDTFDVRAYDAAGNFSTALTATVPLAAAGVRTLLLGDTFTGSGSLHLSRAQTGSLSSRTWSSYVVSRSENNPPVDHYLGGVFIGTYPDSSTVAYTGLERSPLGAAWTLSGTATITELSIGFPIAQTDPTTLATAGGGTTILELSIAGRIQVQLEHYITGGFTGVVEFFSVDTFGGDVGISDPNVGGGAKQHFALPGGSLGTALYLLRIELDPGTARFYVRDSLVATIATAYDSRSSVTLIEVRVPASEPVATPKLDYIHFQKGAPSGPLGRPPDPSSPLPTPPGPAIDPGTGQPDPSAPFFSDFWTSFQGSYEVP